MAQLSKPAIPAKMYRHFAIVTIAATACLGLATNGASDSDDTQAEVQAQPAAQQPRASSTPRYGQARLRTGNTVEVSDGFDSAEVESFVSATSGSSNISAINAIGAMEVPRQGSENAAFTREYLESLSDEELNELLRQLRAGGVEDPAVRQQVMTVLETSARRRSGRATAVE